MGIPIPWAVETDWMVGRDKHNELCLPPWPPKPSDMHKHLVFAQLKWANNADQWSSGTEIYIQNRRYVKHFHNINSFIPHIPLPLPGWVLLVVIIPLSSSKVALGSFSTNAYGQPVGLVGPTLNCASVYPRPSGIVIPTRLPTVFVGFSFVDLLYSVFYCGFDMLLSFVLNKLFDRFFKKFMSKVGDKVAKAIHDKFEDALLSVLFSPNLSDATFNKILSSKLGDVLPRIVGAEGREAASLILSKIATDVTKKYFGKAGKAVADVLKKQVTEWFGRTNPGMQEKYIRVFEAEAPARLGAELHRQHTTMWTDALSELAPADYPGLDASDLAEDAALQWPKDDFVKAYSENFGGSLREGTRGLLSGDTWQSFVVPSAAQSD